MDATLPASGSTEKSGPSCPVHSTGSAVSFSMEHTGHVPPTPLEEEAQEREQGMLHTILQRQTEKACGCVDGVEEVAVLTSSPSKAS